MGIAAIGRGSAHFFAADAAQPEVVAGGRLLSGAGRARGGVWLWKRCVGLGLGRGKRAGRRRQIPLVEQREQRQATHKIVFPGSHAMGAGKSRTIEFHSSLFPGRNSAAMSNQVYANPQVPYYSQRGLTNWALTGGVDQTIAGTATDTILFTTSNFSQTDPGNWSVLNGVFTCVNEGVYAVDASIEVTRAAAANPWWFGIGLEYLSGFGIITGGVIGRVDVLSVAAAFGDATTPYTTGPSLTLYIPAGAQFRFFLNNKDGNALKIRAAKSQIFVTKIA